MFTQATTIVEEGLEAFNGFTFGDFTYMGNGTFNLCDRKINAITANTNSLRNVNTWIAMAFVLQVSSDYYAALYKDIVRAGFALETIGFARGT